MRGYSTSRKDIMSEELHDIDTISALMACRLIPRDKCPVFCPIGIGKVLHGIVRKSVTFVLRPEIQKNYCFVSVPFLLNKEG